MIGFLLLPALRAASPTRTPRTSLQPYLRNWSVLYCPERHTVRSQCLDPEAHFRAGSRCMGHGYNWGSGLTWDRTVFKGDGLVRWNQEAAVGVTLAEVAAPTRCFFYGDTNDDGYITLLREAMPGVIGAPGSGTNPLGMPDEAAAAQPGQ